jgi:chorismate--pyruvate lyase
VKRRSVAHAHWFSHANGVNPPPEMRHWLTDSASLTVKLIARSEHFRVHRMRQTRALCLADECAMLNLPRLEKVREREVLLECDGVPVVFAHTVVPLSASAADWPFFNTLGERSLGTTLFGDPQVQRGTLSFARLKPDHPLTRRACKALGIDRLESTLYARRCLFRRKNGVLLVTEVFLPAIARVSAPGKPIKNTVPVVETTIAQTSGDSPVQPKQSI